MTKWPNANKRSHMIACTMERCILSTVVPHLLKTWQKHCFHRSLKEDCLSKFSCFKKQGICISSHRKKCSTIYFSHLKSFHSHLDEVQKMTSEACFMCKVIQYRTFFLAFPFFFSFETVPLSGEFSNVADEEESRLLMTGSTCFERFIVETDRLSGSKTNGDNANWQPTCSSASS